MGYIATGLKDVGDVRVGETITTWQQPATELLPGYEEPKAMVFAGLYPTNSADYADLTDALEKLRLSDASIHFEAESSAALGFGYRMGFLGLLHMEIVQERLEREFELSYSVSFELRKTDGTVLVEHQTVSLVRDYLFDADQVIGKSREQNVLKKEMRRDAAQRILTRLSAALKKS